MHVLNYFLLIIIWLTFLYYSPTTILVVHYPELWCNACIMRSMRTRWLSCSASGVARTMHSWVCCCGCIKSPPSLWTSEWVLLRYRLSIYKWVLYINCRFTLTTLKLFYVITSFYVTVLLHYNIYSPTVIVLYSFDYHCIFCSIALM